MSVVEQRPATSGPQSGAARSKWAFLVVGGLLLLLAILVAQLCMDEPGHQGRIPAQNGTIKELVRPQR